MVAPVPTTQQWQLIIEASKAESAAGAGVPGRGPLTVQSLLGDDMQKSPLVWKALSEGIFGPDTGGIQNRHYKQLLYQLWYQVSQDKVHILDELAKFMGREGTLNAKMPKKMVVTRWHLQGIAAEDMLARMEEVDCYGDKAIPPILFHMASLEAKGSVAYKGWMFLAENIMDKRHIVGLTTNLGERTQSSMERSHCMESKLIEAGFQSGFSSFRHH